MEELAELLLIFSVSVLRLLKPRSSRLLQEGNTHCDKTNRSRISETLFLFRRNASKKGKAEAEETQRSFLQLQTDTIPLWIKEGKRTITKECCLMQLSSTQMNWNGWRRWYESWWIRNHCRSRTLPNGVSKKIFCCFPFAFFVKRYERTLQEGTGTIKVKAK